MAKVTGPFLQLFVAYALERHCVEAYKRCKVEPIHAATQPRGVVSWTRDDLIFRYLNLKCIAGLVQKEGRPYRVVIRENSFTFITSV
jgi:hypothetical protein